VLPATEETVGLVATLEDGRVVRGECAIYTAADHVRAVQRHAGNVIDVALAHDGPLPRRANGGGTVSAVPFDAAAIAALGVTPFAADLVEPGDAPLHDPRKLTRVLLGLARTA
jgi:2-phospho-L-lactate transferase/gluconeogenesis factor (CofD/UPF0052 family)